MAMVRGRNRRRCRPKTMSDNVILSGITAGRRVNGVVARASPPDSPLSAPKHAKFALDRRTALAPNDRTRAPSRPAKPAQTRAPRRTSARPACRPAGGELLRLRVGVPETGETGIDETREPLFLRTESRPKLSPIDLNRETGLNGGCSGLVAQSHQFRLGPRFALSERTPAGNRIGRDPRARSACGSRPSLAGPRNRSGLPQSSSAQ
jgi:hypothetical protein